MFTLTIKELFARKMRLLSTVFAVLLGVCLMAGTLVFTDTLTSQFNDVLEDAHAGVDAMVRAPSDVELSYGQSGTRMAADTIDAVRKVDGVAQAALEVTGYAQIVGPDGTTIGNQEQAPAFGFNWIDVAELNPYQIVDGTAPQRDGEVVIDRASADEGALQVGDQITVLTQLAPREFTLAGIATFGTADSPGGATAVLFTDDDAQHYLSAPGQVDGVAVQAVDGVSQDEIVARLENVVPELDVVTGATIVEEDQAAFAAAFGPFKIFLLVFAFVAVFVGAFMINNTFSITVAQRTQQLAMLRALGASRRQVLRTVMAEAVAIGIVGAVAGLAAGIGLAAGLKTLFKALGVVLPEGGMVINPTSMIISASVGIVVTVVSAYLPARRAGRLQPIAALRDLAVDREGTSKRRLVIGATTTAIGIAALLAGLGGSGLELVGLGALVALVGVAVLGPVLARPVIGMFGLVVRHRGTSGEMAVRNAQRNPKRTARTASSLMIGVALVAFISVVAASVKTSFGGSVKETFTGSHIVESGTWDGRGGFGLDLAIEMSAHPGVETVSEERTSPMVVDGSEKQMLGFTGSTIGRIFDLGSIEGDLSALGTNGLAVDAEAAAERGWTIGTEVPITLASGDQTFTVVATFDNASEWVGDEFVDVQAFDTYQPAQLDSRIFAIGDDAAIRDVAAAYPSAEVLDADQFLKQVTGEIDVMLGVIYALLALAVLIALLGIANTLALSIFERTRELGLLRAVGMVRSQVRTTIRWEAIMIALFGTTLGLTVGSFFGWASVRALESEGIDQFTYPVANIVVITVVACVAGAIAAVLPARRAANIDVLDAISAA